MWLNFLSILEQSFFFFHMQINHIFFFCMMCWYGSKFSCIEFASLLNDLSLSLWHYSYKLYFSWSCDWSFLFRPYSSYKLLGQVSVLLTFYELFDIFLRQYLSALWEPASEVGWDLITSLSFLIRDGLLLPRIF